MGRFVATYERLRLRGSSQRVDGAAGSKKATPGSLNGLSEGECTRTLEVIVSIELKEQRITDDHSGCCVVVGH